MRSGKVEHVDNSDNEVTSLGIGLLDDPITNKQTAAQPLYLVGSTLTWVDDFR